MRQAQSMVVLVSDLSELQQPAVGADPLPVLPVMKFKHGVKLLIIEVVQGVLICALAEMTEIASRVVYTATICWKALSPSMIFL